MSQIAVAFPSQPPQLSPPHGRLTADSWSWLLAIGLLAAMIGWLALLGRPWGPEGALRWWNSDLGLVHNSQHLADGYSLLHLSFGALICALVRRFNPRLSGARLALTLVASAAVWEGMENLPAVVALFNPPGVAASYGGDSIVNALGDVAFAGAGFALAMRAPWWTLWAGIAMIEMVCAVLVKDGLVWGAARLLIAAA